MFKSISKPVFSLLLAGGLTVAAVPAFAVNAAMLDLLKILQDKGSLTAEEYDLLRNAVRADGEKVAGTANERKAKIDKAAKVLPKINTKGKPKIDGGEHKFRIGGRLMHDITLVDNDGAGDVGASEQQFRRARLFVAGTSGEYWDWKLQIDFEDADDSSQAIEDAYIKYTGWKPAAITVGQRKSPFSLQELTSSKYNTFIERAVPVNLLTSLGFGSRAPGITLSNFGARHSLEGGFYLSRQSGSATDDGTFADSAGNIVAVELGTDSIAERRIDDSWGLVARGAYLPIKESGKKLVHVGAGLGYRHFANKSISRFRVRPAVSAGDRIIDSDGSIAADNVYSVNLEAAVIWGPFSANAEYFYADIDDIGLLGDTDLSGYYIQGSYFLTGESRRYKKGEFSSVKVNKPVGQGGWGAWEVGLRYSATELGGAIGNDEGHVLTAGINWYVNNNIGFRLNYVSTFCDDRSASCDWGTGDGEPGYLSFRSSLFF